MGAPRGTFDAAREAFMYVGIMLTMILVSVGAIFGTLVGVQHRIGKLQQAVDEMKRLAEK